MICPICNVDATLIVHHVSWLHLDAESGRCAGCGCDLNRLSDRKDSQHFQECHKLRLLLAQRKLLEVAR